MRELLKGLSGIDSRFMAFVYGLNAAMELCYFYVMFLPDYQPVDSLLLKLYYYASGGATLALLALLLGCMARKRNVFTRMNLLLALVALEAATVAVDIVFAFIYGEFWADGYVFLILELLLLGIYLRRFFVLRKAKDLIFKETEDAQGYEP